MLPLCLGFGATPDKAEATPGSSLGVTPRGSPEPCGAGGQCGSPVPGFLVFFFFFFKSTQPCLGLNAGAAQCREQTRVVVCKAKCLSPGLSGPSFRTLFSEVY